MFLCLRSRSWQLLQVAVSDETGQAPQFVSFLLLLVSIHFPQGSNQAADDGGPHKADGAHKGVGAEEPGGPRVKPFSLSRA